MKCKVPTIHCLLTFVLFSIPQQILAEEILIDCSYNELCNSAGDCQALETPKKYRLCAVVNQDFDLQVEGISIWGDGLTLMTRGREGIVSAYSGFLPYQPSQKETTVLEWRNVETPNEQGNKITLILDDLMGGSGLYFGDPRMEISLPYYSGFCVPKRNQPCEVPD